MSFIKTFIESAKAGYRLSTTALLPEYEYAGVPVFISDDSFIAMGGNASIAYPNAVAVIYAGSLPTIVINKKMEELKSSNPKVYEAIMLHELGHHKMGHTMVLTKSNFVTRMFSMGLLRNKMFEYEADLWSQENGGDMAGTLNFLLSQEFPEKVKEEIKLRLDSLARFGYR